MHRESFSVGDIDCTVLVHGRGRASPSWMFPDVSPSALADRMDDRLDQDGLFEFVYSSLLVRIGDHVVLVDTSLPAGPDGRRSSIRRHLDAIGVQPSDVGAVVISHGHLDHIGGLVESGEPVFGAATHHIARQELHHWIASDYGAAASTFEPLLGAGLVNTIGAEQQILPGLVLWPTPGHTPGHLAVALHSDGETAVYVGDVLAHEINVAEPDWNHFSDMHHRAAARSRHLLVARAGRLGALVVGSHLVTRGRVSPDARGGFMHVPESAAAAPPTGHRSMSVTSPQHRSRTIDNPVSPR